MRSRAGVLVILGVLLSGVLAPLAGGSHSVTNAALSRNLYEPDCIDQRPAVAGAPDTRDPNFPTAIKIFYMDGATGITSSFHLASNQLTCFDADRARDRYWNASADAPAFKPGDKFYFRVRYHSVVTTSGCPETSGPNQGPSYAGRFTSAHLGLNGSFDQRGNSAVEVEYHNKAANAEGWWTVPKPGDVVPIEADSRLKSSNNTVTAFDRASAADTSLAGNKVQLDFESMYVCKDSPAGSVPAAGINTGWIPRKSTRQHIFLPLDNVLPEVYARSGHATQPVPATGNPEPPQSLAWGARNDLFPAGQANATVNSNVWFNVTICDADYDPAKYQVRIDFQPLNRLKIQNDTRKTRWETRFTSLGLAPLCAGRPGWVLNETVTIADKPFDKYLDGATGKFVYPGIVVDVSDDAAPPWFGGRGNQRQIGVALNVDAQRPLGASALTATPRPDGAVRLDWTIPFDPAAYAAGQHDLRQIALTIRPVDDPTAARTILLSHGSTLVNASTSGNPCVASRNTTAARPSTRAEQWTSAATLPHCLILPDPILLKNTLPLAGSGDSRLYSFEIATRDDAGNGPLPSALQAVATLDAKDPTISVLTPTPGSIARLSQLRIRVGDDTTSAAGEPALAANGVLVSISNATTGKRWSGTKWETGSELFLPMSAAGAGEWAFAPQLAGNGGALTVRFRAIDFAGNVATETISVTHDAVPPTLSVTFPSLLQHGAPFALDPVAADSGDRVRYFTLSLLDATGATSLLVRWCTAGCPTGVTGTDLADAAGPWHLELTRADTPYAAVPLGSFTARLEAFDAAGNSASVTRANFVKIVPRGELVLDSGTPYLAGTKLSAKVLAGFDGAVDDAGIACPSGFCPPDVRIEARTASGSWREIAHATSPTVKDDARRGFEFKFDAVEVGNLGASPLIRAVVTARGMALVSDATTPKTAASEGVAFITPFADWAPGKWFVTRDPAAASFTMRLTPAAGATDPAEAASAVRIRLRGTNPPVAAEWSTATAGEFFTFAPGNRAEGEYEILACAVKPADASTEDPAKCIHPVVRNFAVETTAPTISAKINGESGLDWAARSFVIDVETTIGYDNISALQQIAFTPSVRTDGDKILFKVASSTIELLTTNPSAQTYAIRIAVQMDPQSVALESGTLAIELTTDSGLKIPKTLTVRHDPAAPAVPTPRLPDGSPETLKGWANDTASGVDLVLVTFARDDGSWWNGLRWLAAPASGVPVALACADGTRRECEWELPLRRVAGVEEDAVPLSETGRTYTIRAIATDVAGNSGGPAVQSIKLDNAAPAIGTPATPAGSLVAGGSGQIDVAITDAHSGVRAVEATLRLPGGATRSLGLALQSGGTIRSGTWRLALASADLPYAGTYGVRITATDGGANVAERPEVLFAVGDDAPISFASATATPNPAEAWSGALLSVTVVETDSVAYVRAKVSREGEASPWIDLAPGTVDPVSGAGTYATSTLGAFPLTRGATYVVQFVAKDEANAEVSRNVTLVVSANDRPRLRFLAQAAEGTTWIRAEPTLVWEIDDDNAAPAKVWVEIVQSGVTRNATPTIEGIATGLRATVALSPALAGGEPVTLRLKVADLLGATNVSEVVAHVDAAGPAVVVESAGIVERTTGRFGTAATVLYPRAVDAGSGLVAFEWSRDAGATWQEAPATLPIPAFSGLPNGTLALLFRATDRAQNVVEVTYSLEVDKVAPLLTAASVARDVKVGVVETGIGLDPARAILHVQHPATSRWFPVSFGLNVSSGLWEARVPGNVSGQYAWHAEIVDKAGNVGELGTRGAPNRGFTHNLAPILSLPGFANGTLLRGNVPIVWLADDPEGGAVNVTASIRKGATVVPLPGGGLNATSLVWDTTKVADGDVVLRIVATDGSASTAIERKLAVSNVAVVNVGRAPASVIPGDPLTVRVESRGNLTIRNATATVEREVSAGKWTPVVTGLQLVLDRDGQYKVAWTPTTPGKYRILLGIEYDGVLGMDNLTWGPVEVAAARAPEPGPAFSPLLLAAVAGIVLLVAGAAVAAWRWRT